MESNLQCLATPCILLSCTYTAGAEWACNACVIRYPGVKKGLVVSG
jgi:hypothetical protein